MVIEIPEVVLLRLPIYARTLSQMDQEGIEVVSSQELGRKLQVTPAQIRKDLSYFGKFGKQGRGYNVKHLLGQLRQILGLDREYTVALVGIGRLGRAIANYEGFEPEGFNIVAAFDTDKSQIGKKIGRLSVQDISELGSSIEKMGIDIGIVAVPASHAQAVIDTLVSCGIKAILNYAPITATVPHGVRIREINPVLALQSMTFFLRDQMELPEKL